MTRMQTKISKTAGSTKTLNSLQNQTVKRGKKNKTKSGLTKKKSLPPKRQLNVQKWLFDNMDLKNAADSWKGLAQQSHESSSLETEKRLKEVRQLLKQLQKKITDF